MTDTAMPPIETHDPRLRGAVEDVWARLTDFDQELITRRVKRITSDLTLYIEHVPEFVAERFAWVGPSSCEDRPWEVVVNLDKCRRIGDAGLRGFVAREFAWVVEEARGGGLPGGRGTVEEFLAHTRLRTPLDASLQTAAICRAKDWGFGRDIDASLLQAAEEGRD